MARAQGKPEGIFGKITALVSAAIQGALQAASIVSDTSVVAGTSMECGTSLIVGTTCVIGTQLEVDGSVQVLGGSVQLAQFTVAGVPSAALNTGGLIYVSNGAAGLPIVAFSDGTNWLRVDTRAAIS